MAALTAPARTAGLRTFSASREVESPADSVFRLLCAVEKWPVWLSFVRSARVVASAPLALASDVVVRSSLPGEEEQYFEVDAFVANYHLSLVGAYSLRRRLDFRIEQKTTRSKIHVRLTYPAYHGRLGALLDGWKRGKRLSTALDEALVHFKGLLEAPDDALALVDRDCQEPLY